MLKKPLGHGYVYVPSFQVVLIVLPIGIQSATNSKIAILGQGSSGEGRKEEKRLLDTGEEKYQHLSEPLHLIVQTEGPTSEAHTNMAAALTELKRALEGKYDDMSRRKDAKELEEKENRREHSGEQSGERGDLGVKTKFSLILT